MPPVTPSMTDGKIARWHVAEGQAVAAGDVLVEISTSTATLEIEASSEGLVERILIPAGTEGVKVNTPIAILFGATMSAGRGGLPSEPLGFAALEPLLREPPRSETSAAEARGPNCREALRDALADEMRRDETVFLIGTDVVQNRGAAKVAQGLLDAFGPERVVAIPAAEEALVGLAMGAALAGLRPVVEVTSWGRALEALHPYIVSAAETFYLSGGTQQVPIVFRGPNGFVPGMSGQDSRCVAADLARIPGLKVAQPATPSAARALLKAAIRHPGPVAVLEHELLYPSREPAGAPAVDDLACKARILRAGSDVTIAAAGRAVVTAFDAALALAEEGIEAEVIDLMWARPLDRETVAHSVARTGRLATVEEGSADGGIGAELVAAIASSAFHALRSPPLRIAAPAVPMPYAAELQAMAVPKAADIVRGITGLVRGG